VDGAHGGQPGQNLEFLPARPPHGHYHNPAGLPSPLAQKRPDSLGRSLIKNDNNNVAPRFGFAYQMSQKWVSRGAYGVFYQRYSAQDAIGMSINPPFIRTGDVTLGVRQQDIDTFPIDDLTPVVNFVAPGSRPSLLAIDVNAKDGYVQQWNYYLERSLTQSLVIKTGYVGTKSTGLDIFRYPNVTTPGPGDVQSRRPFTNLSSVRLSKSEGFSTYHGLEVGAQQRFSKGVNFSTGYTWSRTIDNGGLGGETLNPFNTLNDKGLSYLHRKQRFFLAGCGRSLRARPCLGDEHQPCRGRVSGRLAVEQLPVLRDR